NDGAETISTGLDRNRPGHDTGSRTRSQPPEEKRPAGSVIHGLVGSARAVTPEPTRPLSHLLAAPPASSGMSRRGPTSTGGFDRFRRDPVQDRGRPAAEVVRANGPFGRESLPYPRNGRPMGPRFDRSCFPWRKRSGRAGGPFLLPAAPL